MKKGLVFIAAILFLAGVWTASAEEKKVQSPAEGFNIHVLAPHKHEDGTVRGPYHHYCKAIKPEILQCLIFLSTDPNAELVEIEYFVEKSLARSSVSLDRWNRHFHDHKKEIATGRVKVLDTTPEVARKIAETAANTDGIIFDLWPMGARIPNGDVTFPTAVSHTPRENLNVE